MELRVHWQLCQKYGAKCAEMWYKEVPDEVSVLEDGIVEIWWNRIIEKTQKMEHNQAA